MLNIFLCICWPCHCLLWKNVYSDPLPIFFNFSTVLFLSLGCTSCSYILDTYFLQSRRFPFIFDDGFLFCAEAFQFVVVLFVYFCFCFHCFGVRSTKTLLRLLSMRLWAIFFFQQLYSFRSYIQGLSSFQLILLYSIRQGLFFFFACGCPVFPILFLKERDNPFFIIYIYHTLIVLICIGLFLGSQFCFTDLSLCQQFTISLQYSLKSGHDISGFILLSQDVLAIWDLLRLEYRIQSDLF